MIIIYYDNNLTVRQMPCIKLRHEAPKQDGTKHSLGDGHSLSEQDVEVSTFK